VHSITWEAVLGWLWEYIIPTATRNLAIIPFKENAKGYVGMLERNQYVSASLHSFLGLFSPGVLASS
jgi:hypothetical protein